MVLRGRGVPVDRRGQQVLLAMTVLTANRVVRVPRGRRVMTGPGGRLDRRGLPEIPGSQEMMVLPDLPDLPDLPAPPEPVATEKSPSIP